MYKSIHLLSLFLLFSLLPLAAMEQEKPKPEQGDAGLVCLDDFPDEDVPTLYPWHSLADTARESAPQMASEHELEGVQHVPEPPAPAAPTTVATVHGATSLPATQQKKRKPKKKKLQGKQYQQMDDEDIPEAEFNPRAQEVQPPEPPTIYEPGQLDEKTPESINAQHTNVEKFDIPADVASMAKTNFLAIFSAFYIRKNDSQCMKKLRMRVDKQVKILQRKIPTLARNKVKEWFANQPIDPHGCTIAHRAAGNLDPKLLKLAHEIGVDIFKPDDRGIDPEAACQLTLLAKTPMADALKEEQAKAIKKASHERTGWQEHEKQTQVEHRKDNRNTTASSSSAANQQIIFQQVPSAKKQKKLDQFALEKQDARDNFYQKEVDRQIEMLEFFEKVRKRKNQEIII